MSHDQKPARIKLVSSGSPAQVPQSADPALPAAEQAPGNGETGTSSEEKRGWSLVSVALYLVGAAMGGAALAALPHLAG